MLGVRGLVFSVLSSLGICVGCGGQVVDSGTTDPMDDVVGQEPDAYPGGFAPPTAPTTPPDQGGGAPLPACGNSRLDVGELCDGAILNGETCASATMNAAPIGPLYCSTACTLDTSSCKSGMPPRPPGVGGTVGGGGTYGQGGRPPIGGSGGHGARPYPGYGGAFGYPPPILK
jgi:hypothetical protein